MSRLRVSMLVAGVCLMLGVGMHGQTQKPGGMRSVDAAATVQRPVEPDSPAASSAVAAGPQAIVPRLMKFSGALLDASGKPLSGAVDVTFSLYNTEAGGNPLWFETQSVQADELGRYTALLGAMHNEGLPMDLFTSGEVRWLGIQVGLEAEQQPRVLLVSVPYALKAGDAETLGGKPASAYMLSDAQSASTLAAAAASSTATATATGNGKKSTAQTSPLTACSVTSNGAATANSVALFTTACNIENSAITQVNGNIGIGTAAPGYKLEILDNNASLTGFHLKNANSGNSALTQARLENDAGALAYEGIASSTYNHFAPINGGKAFWLSYKTDAVFGNQSLNNIIFAQNGVETARFDTAGHLGIGTASPSYKLDVLDNNASLSAIHLKNASSGNGALTQTRLENNVGALAYEGIASSTFNGFAPINGGKAFWLSYQTDAVYGNQSLNNIIFTQNGTEIARFNTSGRLGIGTTSPAANLEVNGTAKFDGVATFSGGTAFTGAISAASFSGSGAGSTILSATSLNGGLTVVPNATSPNIIGGFSGNIATGGVAQTISGGGVSGGVNSVTKNYGTVGGGVLNTASGIASTVGGGQDNTASGDYSTIAGGSSNSAGGSFATVIGGGNLNVANGADSTIPGGESNSTAPAADHSFAGGYGAQANFSGDFVWADNPGSLTTFTSTAANQFLIRASGGVGIGTASPTAGNLEVNGGIRANTVTAQPTCNSTQRGTFWVVQGGTGVKDSVQVCAKDATDAYAWRTIY